MSYADDDKFDGAEKRTPNMCATVSNYTRIHFRHENQEHTEGEKNSRIGEKSQMLHRK